ncbi:RVT 1 domain containing protein, partial [Asbolus verrucosus]
MYINDLDEVLDVPYLLYADDIKLYFKINDLSDCKPLQLNLDRILSWSIKNKLSLNPEKCVVMTYTRKRKAIIDDYQLNSTSIYRPNFVNDLGVTFDSKLSFNCHIQNVTTAAFNCLGYIIRNFRDFSNINTFISLYSALVRSKLEYACVVWVPTYNIYKNMLESV